MKIFYHVNMSIKTESESNSASKPKLFVDLLKNNTEIEIINNFEALTKKDLELAHAKEYIQHIFNRKLPNGFMNYDPKVAESTLWTTASLYQAGLSAIFSNSITCSPSSGFHHAHYESAAGYCTFNGLVVAARKLITEGYAHRIAILDCDFHYGDGTDDILNVLKTPQIKNFSLGHRFKKNADPQAYLKALEENIKFINNGSYDLVLYQAGADLHIDDPLGGILSKEQLKIRDSLVFNTVNKPIAWNLAGGYHHDYQKTLELHLDTLDQALKSNIVHLRYALK